MTKASNTIVRRVLISTIVVAVLLLVCPLGTAIAIDDPQITHMVWLTGSQTIVAGDVSGVMTVQTRDVTDNPFNVTHPTPVTLKSTSANGKFGATPTGSFSGPEAGLFIFPGSNSLNFYYRDTTPGTPEISVITRDRWPIVNLTLQIDPKPPAVTTSDPVTNIDINSATSNGNITDLGIPSPTQHGFVWGTSSGPTIVNSKTELGAAGATGPFTSNLTGLTPNTTYYLRAYAINDAGTVYGNEVSFTTDPQAPTVTTQPVTGIDINSATANGSITDLGAPLPTQHGFVWSTSSGPTTDNSKTERDAANAIGSFTSNITSLTPDTLYYVRAYATNTAGTVYGNEVSFTTDPQAPTVTTQPVTGIDINSATANGNITDLGVPSPTQHGFVWSTSSGPTTADSKTELGATNATGSFTGNITGLTPDTTYYLRAYAINDAGTVYGTEVSFTTSSQAPTVTTQPVTGIDINSATANGTVTDLGSPSPTQHGFVWSTSSGPTTTDSKTERGATNSTNPFTGNITGLTPNTTYYVRAYAINPAGTVYGNEVSFITNPQAPVVTTQAMTGIGTNSAIANGDISNLGVPSPTQHGFVWGTSSGPTTADSKTELGATGATGFFTSNLTGLTPNTTYYVRAYVTNTAGTIYGNEVSFTTTTPQALPAISTQAVTGIGTISATAHGNITDLGVPSPTQHGFVWSIDSGPTTANSKTELGAANATGSFTSNITGLTPNTTYYLRAYAVNLVGTVYGNEVFFTTLPQAPVVITQAVTGIGTTAATGNGNITILGIPNPTEHGVVWNTGGAPTTADSKTLEGAANSIGTFTTSMTGLSSNTTYYVRAYATNTAGTVYGNEVSFTTDPQAPVVTTQMATGIGATIATGNGNITDLGAPLPTQHGFVWSTSSGPTTADSKTEQGAANATGNFTEDLTGLTPNTTYYVRAYAINPADTVYGNEVSFTTNHQAPVVTTQACTGIGTNSATANGNITDLGVPSPTQHGFVWSTSSGPTTDGSKTERGLANSTGSFTSNITGIIPNTTYYVRAYAINPAGTVYGNEVSFTTDPLAPVVTTQAVTGIGTATATGNGNITDLGVPNATQHGVCWSTNANPDITLITKTQEGIPSSTGAFTSNITGLTPNTTYHVRAYATNSADTTYGADVSFTTDSLYPAPLPPSPPPAPPSPTLEPEPKPDSGLGIDVNMEGSITSAGVAKESWGIVEDIAAMSADQALALQVKQGTVARNTDGSRIEVIIANRVVDVPPEPPDCCSASPAFNLTPDGAQFDPPLIITMRYDPDNLPPGSSEEGLYIAFWDKSTESEWIAMDSTVNTEAHTVSAEVRHFTSFVVMGSCYKAEPAPEPTPVPEPEPTPIPEPEPAPVPDPEPTPIPEPEPTPVPEPEPMPIPAPEPTPVLDPEPTPIPEPEPTPVPEPESIPVQQVARFPLIAGMITIALVSLFAFFFILLGLRRRDRIVFILPPESAAARELPSLLTIELQDARGKPRDVDRDILVDIWSASATGKFDVDRTGPFDGSITSVTIPEGNSTASFYYNDAVTSKLVIKVTMHSGQGRARAGKLKAVIVPKDDQSKAETTQYTLSDEKGGDSELVKVEGKIGKFRQN